MFATTNHNTGIFATQTHTTNLPTNCPPHPPKRVRRARSTRKSRRDERL